VTISSQERELRMGVDINEAGTYDQAARIDRSLCLPALEASDRGNTVSRQTHIRAEPGAPGSVNHRASGQYPVEHAVSLLCCRLRWYFRHGFRTGGREGISDGDDQFADVALGQKGLLRGVDFGQWLRAPHDRPDRSFLDVAHQVPEDLGVIDGGPMEGEVFQIQGAQIEFHHRSGYGA